MNDDRLRSLMKGAMSDNVANEESVLIVSDTTIDSTPETVDPLALSIVQVMKSYQDANKWLDIIKEDLLINQGLVFFSEYVHNLAHTMPVRFDKFGDILHTQNILIPYPPTGDIPYAIEGLDSAFVAIFNILDCISTALLSFIKNTQDTAQHSMACKVEELLIDIDSERENLYRMKHVASLCGSIEFDKWVDRYLKRE